MAEANEIFYDEKTGQVVELVQQPVNPDSFQADLDAAQNSVNEAAEGHNLALDALTKAQEHVKATGDNLEAAQEVLAFQEGRKAAYNKALAHGQNATEDGEEADADDLDGSPALSEAVDVPITLATEQEASL